VGSSQLTCRSRTIASGCRPVNRDLIAGSSPPRPGLVLIPVFGPAALTRAVLPHMRSRRSGAIVQISSMGGQMSFAGFSAYSATKSALEGMSGALAGEVRPLGIKVLIIEPGAFRTSLFGNHSASTPIPDHAGTAGRTRHMVKTSAGTQPGDPAKAAAAILTALDAPSTPLARGTPRCAPGHPWRPAGVGRRPQ
jgi:NAD(P)-dependent dehydrogenase (short-subunit alcohol dehydrogenase family)